MTDHAPFEDRIAVDLRAVDAARAREIRDALQPPAAVAGVISAAAAAPFLCRLMRQEAEFLGRLWSIAPEQALAGILRETEAAEGDAAGFMRALRIQRRRIALLTALADLGGVWPLEAVTGALSDFQAAALRATCDRLLRAEAARGALASLDPERSGYVLLAMGKLGAGELNYSSDIDLIALHDSDRLAEADRPAAKDRFVRLTRELVRLIGEITPDGYVARVDLRLRPDPSSTAVCLSMDAAETYYEDVGRTWERSAHIKARPIAGDLASGADYLKRIEPFVWRRYLDFAALEDAADMLARIRSHSGGGAIGVRGQDIKLGAGGIREIEFLAQTQQLILGGRAPELRSPRTLDALAALTEAGRMDEADRAALEAAYRHHRRLEHRIQMIEDQQTHRIPRDAAELERIAALMGAEDLAMFESQCLEHMCAVRRVAGPQLDTRARAKPTDLADAAAGLPDPERAQAIAENWFSGRLRAVRSPRARHSLERLAPDLLRRLRDAPEPMQALVQFDRFLSGLPAGVQLLALFEANPKLLDLLIGVCAAAPRLADHLARRSAVLDAVLDPDFFVAPPDRQSLTGELSEALKRAADFEATLDAARRWAAERRFQIGVGALQGVIDAGALGGHFSDVAEAALASLWPEVEAEHARRHGPPPGRGAVVLALGRLGSREMTAQSDVDLIIVYDADPTDRSDGERPLSAPQYFARLTQRLTSALTAPTAAGSLYEVDMRLRPSGNSGPLATSLESFRRYHREDAWIWEHMALTRARTAAGAPDLRDDVAASVRDALAQPRPADAVRKAAAEMRGKLEAAHRGLGAWSLKYPRGGLVDLEFIAQTELLIAGGAIGGEDANSAFARLAAAGRMADETARALTGSYDFQTALQQLCRVAVDGAFEPDSAGVGLRQALCERLGAADFAALEARLAEAQQIAQAEHDRLLGG